MSRDHVLNLYCPNGRKQIKPLNICLRFLGVYVTMALFVSAAVVFHGDRPSAQKPSKGFAESVGSVGGWWGLRQVLCKAREGRGAYRTQLFFVFFGFFLLLSSVLLKNLTASFFTLVWPDFVEDTVFVSTTNMAVVWIGVGGA